ncbi:MAG: hypothetical protein E6J79_06880 [Deltaproteobacteria bacterium]|nr:MAG: hypothetical protein E6J79_06880 [Deltaproteobacteria bacterium]
MQCRRYVWAGVMLAALCGCSPDVDELKRGDKEILAKIDAVQKSLDRAKGAAAPAAEPTPDPSKVYDIPLDKSPVRGPKDAPVTIVEFSDFQCPFCAEAKPLLEQVLKAYPADVKLVFKQFPLSSIHDNAVSAAKATVAAGHQNKFWEMHDILFANNRDLSYDKLKEYAGKIGLNVVVWEEDFQALDVQQAISRDLRTGKAADVDGTPAFFVNGRRVMDRSFETFKTMIDDARRAATKKG